MNMFRVARVVPLLLACATQATFAQAARSCVSVDTAGSMYGHRQWVAPEQADSVSAIIRDVEGRLARASAADSAALLLRLGMASAMLSPDEAFAKARDSAYFYNEIGGSWLYTGWHLQELVRRFPRSDLADDAAYELTRLALGGECEGFTSCYVYLGFHRVAEFLREYPASPFADSAAARALHAFAALKPEMDLRYGGELEEPKDIRELVAELDSLGRGLPSRLGGTLIARAGELWHQMGEYELARAAFAAVRPDAGALRACVTARAALMPERWFAIERPVVVHPRRVELRWPRSDGAAGFTVTRGRRWDEEGAVLVRLPAAATSWTDTTTAADTSYWYRVAAQMPGGAVPSIPARAVMPSNDIRMTAMAVSTTDGHLYIFGRLENGFPRVLRVSPVEGTVRESDAAFISHNDYARGEDFREHVSDLWLADDGGVGVLRFPGAAVTPTPAIVSAVRRGEDLLRPTDPGERLVVAVDEARGAAWIAGHRIASALDCLAERQICWSVDARDALVTDDSGRVVARVPIPGLPADRRAFASHLFADPSDGSAWILYGSDARLIHVDRSGTVRHDVKLAESGRMGTAATADFAHRAIWFSRWVEGRVELIRMDLSSPLLATRNVPLDPRQTAVFLAPDLNGGVWVGGNWDVVRIGRDGRAILTVSFRKRPG